MKSQQKCIVIFALVCCFAVLVALIFSAVDVWGEDEDGITEDNCSKNCSHTRGFGGPHDEYIVLFTPVNTICNLLTANLGPSHFTGLQETFRDSVVLVENIPEDILFSADSTSHLPLSIGLNNLLDKAERVVEIVSPHWLLQSSDNESSSHPAAIQGQALLFRLKGLKAKGIQLRISSGDINSTELQNLTEKYAEVHKVNMAALTKGNIHSSFWVVDRKHFYIGSASMDWRSLATRKELGVLVYNCTCLALDLHRVFSLYWGLQYKDFIPTFWSKRLFPYFNKDKPAHVTFNNIEAEAYISSSPDVFNPKDRSSDLEAISRVIQQARHFIYISIIDYLPLIRSNPLRYWSHIDSLLREALILRKVRIRLLISCWEKTHPLTFNFIWSLKSLCMEQDKCSLEAKFFSPREQRNGSLNGITQNRFMVTDRAIYLGNLNWMGEEFSFNAGAGLVIIQSENATKGNLTIVEQLQAVFERDWFSSYSCPIQTDKAQFCNKHQITNCKVSHAASMPIRTAQYNNGPAPLRNHHNIDGQTLDKIIHHDDRLRQLIHQSMAGEQVPKVNDQQETAEIRKNHHDDSRVQINNHNNIPEGPTSHCTEGSGFRDISYGSL